MKLGVKSVPALAALVLVLLVVSRLVYHNLPQALGDFHDVSIKKSPKGFGDFHQISHSLIL